MRQELEQRLKKGEDLLVNVGAHLGIGTLYAVVLASHPRAVIRVLRSEGPQAITSRYREFFKDTRLLL